MKQHTINTETTVVMSDLDLRVQPGGEGPTFKIDTLILSFDLSVNSNHVHSHVVQALGYRVDEEGMKAGRYRRVRLGGGQYPRPDSIQEIVEAQRSRLSDALVDSFDGNSEGTPVPSLAQLADAQDDAEEAEAAAQNS